AIAYSIINFEWPEDLPHRWVRRGAKKAEILVTYTDNLEFSSRLGVNVRPSSPAQLRSIARERLSDPTTADREQRRVSFFSCGLGSMRRFGPRSYGECRQSNALFGPRSAASDVWRCRAVLLLRGFAGRRGRPRAPQEPLSWRCVPVVKLP